MPAADEGEARLRLEEVRRRTADATHHCWAWRLGEPARERSADDGEPAGTAGLPILQVLRGARLQDVVAVVARWFGGTKLGRGGLARAYAAAVKGAVASVAVVERLSTVTLELELPYERHGAVLRLVHPPEVTLLGEEYGERVRLRLAVAEERQEEVAETLAALGIEARRPAG
jgi:uncharacterized YigZ family protein